jgi:hypothetical protein
MACFKAAKEGNVRKIRTLLQAGLDVNVRNNPNCKCGQKANLGHNMLMFAIRYERLEVVNELLSWGADVFAVNYMGYNAVYMAARMSLPIFLAVLNVAGPAAMNQQTTKDGWTPLHTLVKDFRDDFIWRNRVRCAIPRRAHQKLEHVLSFVGINTNLRTWRQPTRRWDGHPLTAIELATAVGNTRAAVALQSYHDGEQRWHGLRSSWTWLCLVTYTKRAKRFKKPSGIR